MKKMLLMTLLLPSSILFAECEAPINEQRPEQSCTEDAFKTGATGFACETILKKAMSNTKVKELLTQIRNGESRELVCAMDAKEVDPVTGIPYVDRIELDVQCNDTELLIQSKRTAQGQRCEPPQGAIQQKMEPVKVSDEYTSCTLMFENTILGEGEHSRAIGANQCFDCLTRIPHDRIGDFVDYLQQ